MATRVDENGNIIEAPDQQTGADQKGYKPYTYTPTQNQGYKYTPMTDTTPQGQQASTDTGCGA